MSIAILPIAAEYVEGFWRLIDAVSRERVYLAFLEAPPIDEMRRFVLDNIAKGHPQFVALDGTEVVGWCDVLPKNRPIYAHCGVLGVGLLPPFRGQGLGARLTRTALDAARRRGVVRVELTVRADNARAIALYERLGFVHEGVMRDASLIDGVYGDVLLMASIDRSAAADGQAQAAP